MAHEDRHGFLISTSSAEAASAYRKGVDLMLAGWTGAAETLERAIGADPDFALPHIARARLHSFYQQGDLARKKTTTARELAGRRGNERERSHVEALALAVEGRLPEALAAALSHIETWPRDALVMAMPLGAFGLFAFSGMADHDRARQDFCERVAHHYGEDWWFLTFHGWSLTENGNVARGRAITERGFGLRRENAHAAHAVLHAMFEDGSIDAADRLIDEWIPSYDRAGICTATSAGIRRSARSSMAMPRVHSRSMPTCFSRRRRKRRHSTPSPTAPRCCGDSERTAMPCRTSCGPRPTLPRKNCFRRRACPLPTSTWHCSRPRRKIRRRWPRGSP